MNLRQAAEKALIQLQGDDAYLGHRSKKRADAIEALRQALAQPVDAVYISAERVHKTEKSIHEPVAWLDNAKCKRLQEDAPVTTTLTTHRVFLDDVALYTAPPKKEWVGLTDDDIAELRRNGAHSVSDKDFMTIEAKLKEKNASA